MCVDCETYDHSRNCGPRCVDHAYEPDWVDGEGAMLRCPRCSAAKYLPIPEHPPEGE